VPESGVAVAALFALLTAWAGSAILASPRFLRGAALDETGGGLRKVHVAATPRIGGLAVVAGLVAGALAARLLGVRVDLSLLLLCVSPGFAWGLHEDLSKRGAVFARLALTGVVPALCFVLLDARITGLEVPGVDYLLAIHAISFLFTLFAVTGVTHSMNVIDGLNGLSGATSLFAALGIGLVAWTVGDAFVYTAAFVLAASVFGFMLLNYPAGRIFLGDGGAYLLGLMLAELAVLLVQRNSEVSPWCPLMLLAYPIWETLFSMYRRAMRGRSAGHADALHLHSLIYRRVVRWKGYRGSAGDQVTRNSIASLCLWGIPAACLVAGVAFWDDTRALQFGAATFVVAYTFAYFRLVRFSIPSWALIRVPRPAALGAGEALEDAPGGSK
jgi:UDP-N-acetylmuramyl pentapeptide phosphotransferase/UDP-N-acetylglucosamine-1-phosphate transferase